MPAFTRAPRSRPTCAPAGYPPWPGGRSAPAARRHRTQNPNRERGVMEGMPAEVTEHLRAHHVITLSTASVTGMPHADTVAYASDADSIFFVAGAGTQLLHNLNASRWVSFTIDDYTPGWAKVRELQGAGRCLPATAAQHAAAWPVPASTVPAAAAVSTPPARPTRARAVRLRWTAAAPRKAGARVRILLPGCIAFPPRKSPVESPVQEGDLARLAGQPVEAGRGRARRGGRRCLRPGTPDGAGRAARSPRRGRGPRSAWRCGR